MLNKQIKIAIFRTVLGYSSDKKNYNWEQKFLNESLNHFKSEEIAGIIDLNIFKPKINNSCDIGLQLFALKNSLPHIKEPYILLLDNNLALINSLEKLILGDDIYVSQYGYNRFDIKSAHYSRSRGEHETVKNIIYNFYKTQINIAIPANNLFVAYDFPFLIKKSVLEKIIDRWIELTMLLFYSRTSKENPITFRSHVYTFAFSITLLEYNITPTVLDIVYFNSVFNKNNEYIFYDMTDDLIVNIPGVGAKTIFRKGEILNPKIYQYESQKLNNTQNTFMSLLNNFIIKQIVGAKTFELIPV